MSESVVNLIKQAQQAGEPLFKGDVAGHEFHGNQYTGESSSTSHGEKYNRAADSAKKASEKANKTGNTTDHANAADAHLKAARLSVNDEKSGSSRVDSMKLYRAHTEKAQEHTRIAYADPHGSNK